eukprot:m.38334 g.38334  ORF g.38334 m.38334 type:complete len:53 (-) comp10207_c0_seq1:474-632(-)
MISASFDDDNNQQSTHKAIAQGTEIEHFDCLQLCVLHEDYKAISFASELLLL